MIPPVVPNQNRCDLANPTRHSTSATLAQPRTPAEVPKCSWRPKRTSTRPVTSGIHLCGFLGSEYPWRLKPPLLFGRWTEDGGFTALFETRRSRAWRFVVLRSLGISTPQASSEVAGHVWGGFVIHCDDHRGTARSCLMSYMFIYVMDRPLPPCLKRFHGF